MEATEESPSSEAVDTYTPSASNFQKKITPWKILGIPDSLLDTMSEELVSKKRNATEDGLIVVASLIDKIPNLGGLCRSCEIFGVSKYVVSSFNVLHDQQFQNLSVSAHRWVNMMEVLKLDLVISRVGVNLKTHLQVPCKDLSAFLLTYKSKGYRILGIEQAEDSKNLNEYTFPKKSLILLG